MSVLLDYSGNAILGDRDTQEDFHAFLNCSDGSFLSVLADGMGGHSSGEVASRLAVETFIGAFDALEVDSVSTRLSLALERANNEIARRSRTNPEYEGMGCTLLAVHISVHGLFWISVGDSPLYLARDGKVRRLNADHSMMPVIMESLRAGKITADEAANHPQRNVLRSALTGEQLSLVDASQNSFQMIKGDQIILASDGIFTLEPIESQLSALLRKLSDSRAETATSAILSAVNTFRRPRQDNTTVQVLRILGNYGALNGRSKNYLPWLLGFSFLSIFGFLGTYLIAGKFSANSVFDFKETTKPTAPVPVPVVPPQPTPDKQPTKKLESSDKANQELRKESKKSEKSKELEGTGSMTPPSLETPGAAKIEQGGGLKAPLKEGAGIGLDASKKDQGKSNSRTSIDTDKATAQSPKENTTNLKDGKQEEKPAVLKKKQDVNLDPTNSDAKLNSGKDQK